MYDWGERGSISYVYTHFTYYSTRNDSIWHGHNNEWVAIFLRSALRVSNDFVSLATTSPVFIVGTLSHVQFIYIFFFVFHCFRSYVDPFLSVWAFL